jgi:7-cyano-7-deazaguanine synthase
MKKAVVLLSGGLDSSTVMAIAKNNGYSLYALSFDYNQRHRVELDAAHRVAEDAGAIEHKIISMDMRAVGGSALTADIDVPKSRSETEMGEGIPVTYVPARNTVFLSYALAWAETLNTGDIFIGVNALDYSGYPDCRPEFIKAYETMANLATKEAVEGRCKVSIHTPLISMTKAEIITEGRKLGVKYELTSSCYDPRSDGAPCQTCDSCYLRAKGFTEAGCTDPLLDVGASA